MSQDKDKRIAELETQVYDLERDLIHDPLTGLKTRVFFEEELSVYLTAVAHNEQGKRKEWFGFRNISIIFFDIDHFKNVNDKYGHDVGDAVLRKVAETIQASLRTGDTPARWGGEEIVVSLLGADEKDAIAKAEEIRIKVETLTFPEVPDLHLTISSGVASSEKGLTLPELVKRVDQALYTAKSAGRNKVVAYMAETKNKELHRIVSTALVYRPDLTYLITKRALHKKVMPGKWTIPGGGLTVDDYINTPPSTTGAKQWYGALENSLRREVKEETNLEISKPEFLTDYTFIRPDGIPVLGLSYIASYVSGEVKLDDDATEFAWISADEVGKYDFIDGIDSEIKKADDILKKRRSI